MNAILIENLHDHLDMLGRSAKVGVARIIRAMQIKGLGREPLRVAVETAKPVGGEADSVKWLATDQGCEIGNGLTVDQVHAVLAQSGVTV